MKKKKKITSSFNMIETYVIDQVVATKIVTIINNLKIKGRSVDIEVSKNIKNIVNRALAETDENIKVEIYCVDMYEESKLVKIKVIINQNFDLANDGLKTLADKLLKTLKVKQINYGLSNARPALIIWM